MNTIPNINVTYTQQANKSGLSGGAPQLSGSTSPISPQAASDFAPTPQQLASASTHQPSDSPTRSPFLNNYTLSQATVPVPGCTGNTSQMLSPVNSLAQKLPELVDIPISHSLSYQPIIHEPQLVSQTQKSRPPRNKSKFKRFRNAFIFYVNDQRSKVDEETKKLKNREFLRLMSSRWKGMSEEERKPYVQLAEEDKRRFDEDEKKFGKYESRQRRYNKVRKAKHGTAPYPLPQPAHAQLPNMLAANPALFLSNVTPGQAGVNAAALSHLYMSLQKPPTMNSQATSQVLSNPATHPGLLHQPFLAPPALNQRNSASSTSSIADPNDLHSSFGPSSSYNWSAGLGGTVPAAQYPSAGGLYQQPSSPGFMQAPTGVPISHSQTHPAALYDSGLNLAPNGSNSGSNWPLQP